MNYVIEFSDGSHGILPNDNLEYSVSRGRVIVYKDGEKVLDKEIGDCPSGKCEIITSPEEAPDVQVLPVDGEVVNKDIQPEAKVGTEYNIGTMLPQGCGVVPTINQAQLMMAEDDTSNCDDKEEVGPISPEANAGFLRKYIEDCRKRLEYEKNKPTPNQSIIDDIKGKLDTAIRSLKKYGEPDLRVLDGNKGAYVAASDNSIEDGEVITEAGVGTIAGTAAVGAGAIAGGIYGITQILKLIEMGTDKVITTAQRPKYKKVLDTYYDLFMQKDAPKFSSLKKSKYFATETGDKKNPIIGILQKYGFSREYACVNYSYNDNPVCGCFMDKKYKASFDIFTYLINGGDVVKVNFGWTKHLQTKVLAYKKYEKYYVAYMHLMLGFIDNAFKDIVRDINAELKKYKKDINDLKKESADDINIIFTLTEAANDYINLINDNVEESAKDVILNFATEVNVSRKIRVLIVELALMRARLNILTNTNAKKEKIAKLKRDIIAKEKEKRSLLEGQNNEVKSAVKKIEKAAVKEASKDAAKEKEDVKTESIVDVIPLVEETKDDDKEKKSLHVSIREEKIKKIDEKLATLKKEPRSNTSQIKALEEEKEKLEFEIAYRLKKEENVVNEEEAPKTEGIPEPIKFETSTYVDALSSFVNEAANIDPAIKDIIAALNDKGYNTRYSSAGHFKLRKKEDREPDGVYHGKLYSDARVQFKGTFHFGAAPKYWFWKKVDGDDYLDVVPLIYNDKDGTPDEAFAKWRTNYLNSLDTWAKKLPSAESKKDDEPTPKDTQIKEESAKINTELDNYFDSIFRENGIRE